MEDREHPSGPPGGLDHAIGLGQRDRHRLVDDDVLAGLERLHGQVGVGVVRGRDHDQIDVGGRDELREGLVGRDAALAGGLLAPAGVARRDRPQLEPIGPPDQVAVEDPAGVAVADDANSDHGAAVY